MEIKKKSTAWWTEEVKEAVKTKMDAFKKGMKIRCIETRLEAETVKRTAKREI